MHVPALARWVSGVAAVAAIVAVIIAVVLPLFSALPAANHAAAATCTVDSVGGVKVSMAVTVETRQLETPRITTDLTVRMPAESAACRVLLKPVSDDQRRETLRRLVEGDRRRDSLDTVREFRAALPTVTQDGPWLVLHDSVRTDMWGHPTGDDSSGQVNVGLAVVEPHGPAQWRLWIRATSALKAAQWDVSVRAPVGWLAMPGPQPTSIQAEQVTWHGLQDRPGPEIAEVLLQLDLRTQVTANSLTWPWEVVSTVLFWLSGLLLASVAIISLRRRHDVQKTRDPAWRLAWPPLVIMVGIAPEWIVRDRWAESVPSRGQWDQYWWVLAMASVAMAAVCALLWRLPWRTVTLLAVAAVGPALWLWYDTGWPWSDGAKYDVTDQGTIVGLLLWAALVGSILLLAGLLNAVRLLYRPTAWPSPLSASSRPQPVSAPLWVWLGACMAALVLTGERVVLNTVRISDWRWLTGVATTDYCCGLTPHGWMQLQEIAWFVLILSAIAMARGLGNSLQGEQRLPASLNRPGFDGDPVIPPTGVGGG